MGVVWASSHFAAASAARLLLFIAETFFLKNGEVGLFKVSGDKLIWLDSAKSILHERPRYNKLSQ